MPRFRVLALGALALIGTGLTSASTPIKAHERREIRIVRGGAGYLGVVLEDVDKDDMARLKLAEERGAIVKEITADSPAAKAGLRDGDVILGYQAERVQSVAQLVRLVSETPAGRSVTLEISRGGALQKLSATLDERKGLLSRLRMPDMDFDFETPLVAPVPPVPPAAPVPPLEDMLGRKGRRGFLRDFFVERGPRKLGIGYQEISGQLAKYFRLSEDGGVLVTHVEDDGPAGKSGMKAGDVILKLDGKAVREGDDLRDAVGDAEPGKEVTITVQRDGKPLDLKVKLGGQRDSPKDKGETT